MRILKLSMWSFLLIWLVSSCDKETIEEENHVKPEHTVENVNVFKKLSVLKASNISTTTTDDLFVNRNFFVGENNLYVINNVDANWAVEVFDRNSLDYKSTLKTWTEGGNDKSFKGTILSLSEKNGRLYVSNKSHVQIFDTESFEFIARAGTGNWWTEESITITNSYAACSFKDQLFVRERNGLAVFNEADLIKGKPQSEIKVVARTTKGVFVDMAYGGKFPVSMVTNNDLLYVTDVIRKKVFIINPTQIVASQPIPIQGEIALSTKPISLTFFQNKMYILCEGGLLLVYNAEGTKLLNRMIGIDQYLFNESVNNFTISTNDENVSQIFINNESDKEIVVGVVENVEIKIYK